MRCPCDNGVLVEQEEPVKNINLPVKGSGVFYCTHCDYKLDTKN